MQKRISSTLAPKLSEMRQGTFSADINKRLTPNFEMQCRLDTVLKDFESCEYRTAVRLASYNIVQTSVLGLPLLSNNRIALPSLQLPFQDLPSESVPELKGIIEKSKGASNCLSESGLLGLYWDPIFLRLLSVHKLLSFEFEFNMTRVHPIYAKQTFFVDRAFVVKLEDGYLPLLFIEAGLFPVNSIAYCFKDEIKIAYLMAQSLLASIGMFRSFPSVLNKLRVYGLLIGGDEVEVVAMYPHFHNYESLKFDLIFETSRSSWRFNLFLEPGQAQPLPPAVSSTIIAGSREDLVVGRVFSGEIPPLLANPKEHKKIAFERFENRRHASNVNEVTLGVIQRVLEAVSIQAEVVKCGKLANAMYYSEKFLQHPISSSTSQFGGTPMKRVRLSRPLEDAFSEIDSEDEYGGVDYDANDSDSSNDLDSDDDNDDDLDRAGFQYDPTKPFIAPTGSNLHVANEEEPRVVDEQNADNNDSNSNMKAFTVTKTHLGHELDVYQLSMIASSHFFPNLLHHEIAADGKGGRLVLEELLPFRYLCRKFSYQRVRTAQLRASEAFSNGVDALQILHGAGFIHGDISPNNIGFNRRVKKWQLYDFNQSCPIQEASTTTKHGGTRGFRSKAFEAAGLFFPIDDYVALYHTCTDYLSEEFYDKNFMEPFLPLESLLFGSKDRSQADLKAIQLMATSICKRLRKEVRQRPASKQASSEEDKENFQNVNK